MTDRTILVRDEDFDDVNPGEVRPLIEEGRYPARLMGRECRRTPWGEKLYFFWEVFLAWDRSSSVTLNRYYNVKRDAAGRFIFGPLHDYRIDWIASNGGPPLHERRLSPAIWAKGIFLVEVVTVRRGRKGMLPPGLYWSRINRIFGSLGEEKSGPRLPMKGIEYHEEIS